MIILKEKELYERLKIGRKVLINLRRNGLPHILLGERCIRYDYDEVMEYLNQNKKVKSKGEMKND